MRNPEKDNILLRKEREINSLKLQLQEAKELATIKEKVLKAELKETEKLYKELTKKLEDIQAKSFEIRVLKALNEIIAAASKYLSLSDIPAPTLKAVIESLETLEEIEGRKVKITGGVFLLNEETGELFLATSYGISPKDLKGIGDIIKKNFHSVDIAARYGGEEFVVVLIETPLKQAEDVAERLRSLAASHIFHIEGKTVSLTVSIGLASFPADSDTGEGLVKAADHALYNAKNSGRNRVFLFAPSERKP